MDVDYSRSRDADNTLPRLYQFHRKHTGGSGPIAIFI